MDPTQAKKIRTVDEDGHMIIHVTETRDAPHPAGLQEIGSRRFQSVRSGHETGRDLV